MKSLFLPSSVVSIGLALCTSSYLCAATMTIYDSTTGTPDPTDSSHAVTWGGNNVVTGNGNLGGLNTGDDNAGAVTSAGVTAWQINDQDGYADTDNDSPRYHSTLTSTQLHNASTYGFTTSWTVQHVSGDANGGANLYFEGHSAGPGVFDVAGENGFTFGGTLNDSGILLTDGTTQINLAAGDDWSTFHTFNLQWDPDSSTMSAWWDDEASTTDSGSINPRHKFAENRGNILISTGDNDSGDRIVNLQEITLTTNIPEPSSTVLIGLGGLALILRRRL